jgi:putative transposase
VGVMCRLLADSRSGFYAWHDRPMSARARRDVELTALIHQIHAYSYGGTYGAPRIHMELRETYGIRIGRKRVERLMRRAGLQGCKSAASVAPRARALQSVSRRIWCNGTS